MDAQVSNSNRQQAIIDQLMSQIGRLHLELAQLKTALIDSQIQTSDEPRNGYIESNGTRIPIPDNISPEAVETLKNLDIR